MFFDVNYQSLRDILYNFFTVSANFLLEDVNKYAFLKNGYISLPNVDDAGEFHNTIRAMKIMGFHDEEISCKKMLLKIVLKLINS